MRKSEGYKTAAAPTKRGAALQRRRVSKVEIRAAPVETASGCRQASGAKGSKESWGR
jgi:hypothetical protein